MQRSLGATCRGGAWEFSTDRELNIHCVMAGLSLDPCAVWVEATHICHLLLLCVRHSGYATKMKRRTLRRLSGSSSSECFEREIASFQINKKKDSACKMFISGNTVFSWWRLWGYRVFLFIWSYTGSSKQPITDGFPVRLCSISLVLLRLVKSVLKTDRGVTKKLTNFVCFLGYTEYTH